LYQFLGDLDPKKKIAGRGAFPYYRSIMSMTDSQQEVRDDSDPLEGSGKTANPASRSAIIDEGFRGEAEPPFRSPAFLALRKRSNAQDRRNLKFLTLAVSVTVILFVGLEYKQFHEVAREAKQEAMGAVRHANHSLSDFFR
jgi:hypothetical protein